MGLSSCLWTLKDDAGRRSWRSAVMVPEVVIFFFFSKYFIHIYIHIYIYIYIYYMLLLVPKYLIGFAWVLHGTLICSFIFCCKWGYELIDHEST